MKIQLDTTAKVIKIEEAVNFGELFELLERILPNGVWKEFKLEPAIINTWTNPIIIPFTPTPLPYPIVPTDPWQQPWITYDTNNSVPSAYGLNDGVFNIEFSHSEALVNN